MSLQGASAFVTGGTGLIGGRLIEVLTAQYGMNVRALIRNNNASGGSYRAAGFGAEFVHGDITDEAAMTAALKGCNYVFHCAFGTSGDVNSDRHVTINGTTSLVRAAAANGVSSFVNLSTMVVFGDTPPVVNEAFIPQKMWDWPYPRDKLAAEKAVLAENARSNLPTTTLRLGTVYGPWASAFTVYPIECLTSGRVVLVNEGRGVSNAVFVDDAIQAIILAALRKATNPETFIIRGPNRVTWREFYDAYEAMLGTNSLVCMTREQVQSDRRRRRVDAVRKSLPAAVRVLKKDREFKSLAGQLPVVKPAWKLYRRFFSPPSAISGVSKTESRILENSPLYALPDSMWGYYASQTDYRIDHARAVLNYKPMFDLAKGMAMTQAWAEWAGLIPTK